MRNKKLVFVATLILTISVLLCAFVGCNKEPKPAQILTSFYKDETKPTAKTVELTNLEGYTVQTIYGEFLVATKYDEEREKITYALFDVVNNKISAESDYTFKKEISGVFSTVGDAEEGTRSFFRAEGGHIKTVKEGEYTTGSKQIVFSDGTAIALTKEGIVYFDKTLNNAMDMVNFSNADVYENGDFVILNDYRDNFLVYEKEGAFRYSVKLSSLVNASEDDTVKMANLGKGKAVIQVLRELTEVEAENGFDYTDNGKYYSVLTYLYDIESRALKAIGYDKIIYGDYTNMPMSKDDNYALLYVYDISTKHIASDIKMIVTDLELNEKVRLDDFVKGAKYFMAIDESTFAIFDNTMIYYFNEKGEKINEIYESALKRTKAGVYKVGNRFYDIKGNELFQLRQDMLFTDGAKTDGLIYYMQEKVDEAIIGVFNSKTGTTVTYDVETFDSISEELFTISDSDGNITIYNFYDGKAISNKIFASATARTGEGYTIITAIDADGNVTYFSYTIETPEK